MRLCSVPGGRGWWPMALDPVLVEKATRVAFSREGDSAVWDELPDEVREAHCADIEAAIRIVFDELPPLDRVSFLAGYIAACSDRASGVFPGNDVAVNTFAERAWKQTGVDQRRPVEQGDADRDE